MTIHQSGVTIKEAARILNISEAAVRQRLLRRTLSSTRHNGRVFVLLPNNTDLTPPDDPLSRPDNTSDDTIEALDDTAAQPLVSQLRSENALLREQLIIKDRQIGELHVMLQTAQRQLPATVPDVSHPSERPEGDDVRVRAPNVAPGGVQREIEALPKQRWPWWMRLLGGK